MTGPKTKRTDEAEALMDRGYDLLRRNNAQEALKVGQQLERRRYSGGFEIQAHALLALNRRTSAIDALERGVDAVPGNWSLWQYLGSCRSDDGDYEGAFAAYERALACDGYAPEIQYNYAEALRRAGRWDDAKDRIEALFASGAVSAAEPPALGLHLVNLYEDIMLHEGRIADARAMIEKYSAVIARTSKGR